MTLEAQVQWLADRAQISDLLHAFARALDTKDWEAYTATMNGRTLPNWRAAPAAPVAEAVAGLELTNASPCRRPPG